MAQLPRTPGPEARGPRRSALLVLTALAVLVALLVTGYYSAKVGGENKNRAILRVVFGGMIAMIITYFVGVLFGTAVL